MVSHNLYMGRNPQSTFAPGIYQRNGIYWLRYSVNGKEIRRTLRTRIDSEAFERAKALRGQTAPDSAKGSWNQVIEKYLREKQNEKRPIGFMGRRWQMMRPGTVVRVRSCLNVFAKWTNVPGPAKVTLPVLERYAQKVIKKSKAGGRTTIATIHAFLEHVGCLPGRVQLPSKDQLEVRESHIAIHIANLLIEFAKDDPNMLFILFCGFHAGLRRGEIMHATYEWFIPSRAVLKVPRIDHVGGNTFRIKDNESREIPLSKEFRKFFTKFFKDADRKKGYCLKNPRKRKSKSGTYDFRVPFNKFISDYAEADLPHLTIHSMRHSWITALCNSGNHLPHEVAAWSGDTLQTIENTYWHKRTVPGALDETMAGIRRSDEERKSREALNEVVKFIKAPLLAIERTPKIIEEED